MVECGKMLRRFGYRIKIFNTINFKKSIMQVPERADEQVFYQIMKMAEKSMLERIGEVQRERREYKEYIEQWIHEVKTPITAMKLLCENNRSPFSREVLAELENINQYRNVREICRRLPKADEAKGNPQQRD